MNRNMRVIVILMLCVGLIGSLTYAATDSAAPTATESEGLDAAKALTKITGIAISPLLGVGAVGAYDFFTCPKGKESKLPWYAQVKFWLPALLLVGACAAKDGFGTAFPPGLKKPFDVLETMENKLTGLIAAGTVVPSLAAVFHSTVNSAAAHSPTMQAGLLGVSFAPLLNILTIPLAITAFVLVWMVGHVTHVLILISPWGGVDAALKAMRTSVIGFLAMVGWINPVYGAILSLIIIAISYFISGWSFRLMIFGTVYTWDFFSFRRHRFTPSPNGNWMFTAHPIGKTPIRSYGRLLRAESGELTFVYRPWLVLPQQTLALPAGKYAVGRGLFYPEIMTTEGEKHQSVFLLPPRYKHHEEELSRIYAISDIRDVGLLKGLKAIWNWIKGGTTHTTPAPA